ncbi:MAG: hypothetical protein PF961_11705 [Planctomycetota bacterium]|nr:hypothetical protein [Planctomycetota bacterium]
MSPQEHAPTDLIRALEAIRRTQTRWLADVERLCQGDPRFQDAFRSWQEQLTLLKLHIHRAEQRLLHFLLVPEEHRPWTEFPGLETNSQAGWQRWMRMVGPYFRSLHIDTSYRRLGCILDPLEEAVTADVLTDLVAVCEVADSTNRALEHFHKEGHSELLEDLAFYHVLSPWKQHGLPALGDLSRWLTAFLAEHEEL